MSSFNSDFQLAVYTPSELNREVRIHLEAGFSRISIEGEISNLAKPASGHFYFSLKDSSAQVRCAMFRNAAMRISINPVNGMLVQAQGRISLYEPRGEYQFIVETLQDAGVGLLQQRFEELKKKLEAEGLFAAERKRSLPAFPFRIGVITSPSGAVIRDILHVLERRWPAAEVRVYPSAVQGNEAPAGLQAALAKANRESWAEVLIIARGGGSIEDLQAFNDEALARAVAASALPVVSAVGHETDFSICDFVADLRAPTPSAAAEIITPDREQLAASLQRSLRLLVNRMQFRLQQHAQQLDHLAHRMAQQHPELKLRTQRKQIDTAQAAMHRAVQQQFKSHTSVLLDLQRRLNLRNPRFLLAERRKQVQLARQTLQQNLQRLLERNRRSLHDLARTLDAVSPLSTLDRGYSVLLNDSNGKVVSSSKAVKAGQRLLAQLSDGRLHCTVDSTSDETILAGASPKQSS